MLLFACFLEVQVKFVFLFFGTTTVCRRINVHDTKVAAEVNTHNTRIVVIWGINFNKIIYFYQYPNTSLALSFMSLYHLSILDFLEKEELKVCSQHFFGDWNTFWLHRHFLYWYEY